MPSSLMGQAAIALLHSIVIEAAMNSKSFDCLTQVKQSGGFGGQS